MEAKEKLGCKSTYHVKSIYFLFIKILICFNAAERTGKIL